MTFSVAARCESTGMFGLAVSSSSPAVAARCAFARAGIGAVLSQNITDPALGSSCLELMAKGASAQQAIDNLVANTENIQFRQLTAVDANGQTGHFLGERSLGVYASSSNSNVVCAGNLLKNDQVPEKMASAFANSTGHLADRLIQCMEAGLEAGGEAGPLHSAGMLVVDKLSWPIADLRVDWLDDRDPIAELRKLWNVYAPQLNDYVTRALNPASAPGYGVPGDD